MYVHGVERNEGPECTVDEEERQSADKGLEVREGVNHRAVWRVSNVDKKKFFCSFFRFTFFFLTGGWGFKKRNGYSGTSN